VPMSTIGYEKRFNPAIRAASSEQAFVDFILSGQPEPPMYFATMKRLNKVGPPVLGGVPRPKQMTAEDLRSVDAKTTAIVDTREWPIFRGGHVPGSLSLPLIKSFNTDAGSLIGPDEPMVLVIEPDRLDEAVRDLIRIGLDRIEGWVDAASLGEYEDETHELVGTPEVDVEEASNLIESGAVRVLDVRRKTEYNEAHLEDATNIAHTRLMSRLDEVPDGKLLVHCRSGVRSARASAYLQRLGREVINLKGGILAWQDEHDVVKPSQTAGAVS
ncbi:MAG: rhodanese-like domain-containing protein, partial [Phycisphaerales bacterium JB065]